MSSRLEEGDCVETKQGIGLIKYIGTLHGKHHLSKPYIGIELLQPIPNGHDGIIDGHRYFNAKTGHGMRVSIHQVIRKLSVAELFKRLQNITLQYFEATKFFTEKIKSIQSPSIPPIPTPAFSNKLQSPVTSITATFTYKDTTDNADSEMELSSDTSSDDSDIDSVKSSSSYADDDDDEEDDLKDIGLPKGIPLFISRSRSAEFTKSSNLPKYPLRSKLVKSRSAIFSDCAIAKTPKKYIQKTQKEHHRGASSPFKYKSR